MGGYGLRSLYAMYQALLCKWLWRFGEEVGSLWRCVVPAKYWASNDWFPYFPSGTYGCSPWRGIVNYLPLFRRSLSYEVGDGRCIKFWDDVWCGERPLREEFLDIFALAMDSSSMVSVNMVI